jgi:hypothetical protein
MLCQRQRCREPAKPAPDDENGVLGRQRFLPLPSSKL